MQTLYHKQIRFVNSFRKMAKSFVPQKRARPLQKRLAALGYSVVGEPDGIAGPFFTAAVVAYQEDHRCWVDGELTAGHKTWKCLLGLQ